METWWDYRTVWSKYPYVLGLFVVAVAVVIVAVVATATAGPLAFLFIPGLALLYFHHLVVRKRLPD